MAVTLGYGDLTAEVLRVNKPFINVAAESTCLKRVTVCELFAADGSLLARESNRCDPPDGKCCRLETQNSRGDYPSHSDCRWTHAEAMALRACDGRPGHAILYGHDFVCPDCEAALRAAGVSVITVFPKRDGVGLRP